MGMVFQIKQLQSVVQLDHIAVLCICMFVYIVSLYICIRIYIHMHAHIHLSKHAHKCICIYCIYDTPLVHPGTRSTVTSHVWAGRVPCCWDPDSLHSPKNTAPHSQPTQRDFLHGHVDETWMHDLLIYVPLHLFVTCLNSGQ